ncbi:MAG: type II toxin-antitoxin system RelE/ParE family toxin [Dehalococcoidia bacterium]
MARVVWSDEALESLEAIADQIGETSPAYASLFVRRAFDAAALVEDFPRLGRVVPEFGHDTLREIIFQNYRIVYRVGPVDVDVLTVVHGAMDLSARADERTWRLQ